MVVLVKLLLNRAEHACSTAVNINVAQHQAWNAGLTQRQVRLLYSAPPIGFMLCGPLQVCLGQSGRQHGGTAVVSKQQEKSCCTVLCFMVVVLEVAVFVGCWFKGCEPGALALPTESCLTVALRGRQGS